MKTLVLIEHDNKHVNPVNLNVVAAACMLAHPVHALVIGYNCLGVAEQVGAIEGVKQVLLADNEVYVNHLAENVVSLMAGLAHRYNYFLGPASTFGKNILPRLAAVLDVAQVSDVVKIINNNTFVRPIYAGNAFSTVRALDDTKVLTVRPSAFAASTLTQNRAPIDKITDRFDLQLSQFIEHELSESKRPDLVNARVIVSGGRGLQTAENFKLIEKLADCLGAAVGSTRAAVDSGFVPNDYQIGQTGKIVAPDLYFAVGISGAIQHLAGMKDSRIIVAINKDAEAPIFEVATYGIVGDLFELVPQLVDELKAVLK